MADDEPAGWLAWEGADTAAVDAMLARFGQVYRLALPDGPPRPAPAPGQPCFLVRTDRSRVVGIWAVGEVVAPCLTVPAGTPPLPAEPELGPAGSDAERCYAEVELFPLAKPLALDRLRSAPPLADGALADPGPRPVLRALDRAQVRAVEGMEFWIEAPDDDQRRALDDLLAAEDAALG